LYSVFFRQATAQTKKAENDEQQKSMVLSED